MPLVSTRFTSRFFARAARLRPALLVVAALALAGAFGGCGKAAAPPRALVLGLDGATWKLLRPMMDKGELPNLKALADGGVSGNLRSVIPFLSPPAWTSAITGTNPGKHGIYDFLQRLPNQMLFVNVSARARRVPPIWMLLSDAGMKVAVVNVPATDPPDPVNGFMISGLPHLGVSDYTYPKELEKELKDYRLEKLQISLVAGKEDSVLNDILLTMRARAANVETLLKTKDWQFAWIVFTETDRVQHFFWQFMDPEWPGYDPVKAAKYGSAIHDLWVELDGYLGRIIAIAREKQGADLPILVLSDHGFGGVHREFRLQSFLRNPPAGQKPITESYSPETNGAILYFLKKGREPVGTLEDDEFTAERADVVERVKHALDPVSGKPPVRGAFRREDLYRGRYSEKSPDVVMVPAPGVYISNDRGDRPAWGDPTFTFSGHHEMEGVLIASGGPFGKGHLDDGPTLLDITPTLLYLLGRPVPAYCDGSALKALFTPEFVKAHAVQVEKRELDTSAPDDTASVPEAMKGLGYIN